MRGLQHQPSGGDYLTHSHSHSNLRPIRIADAHPIRAGLPHRDPMPGVLKPGERAAVAARSQPRV